MFPLHDKFGEAATCPKVCGNHVQHDDLSTVVWEDGRRIILFTPPILCIFNYVCASFLLYKERTMTLSRIRVDAVRFDNPPIIHFFIGSFVHLCVLMVTLYYRYATSPYKVSATCGVDYREEFGHGNTPICIYVCCMICP